MGQLMGRDWRPCQPLLRDSSSLKRDGQVTQAEVKALCITVQLCNHSQECQMIKEVRVIMQVEAKAVFSGVRQWTQ